MVQIPGLYVVDSDDRGRGVFTSVPIQAGDIIEFCQILKIPKVELPIIHKTILHDYYFLWGPDLDQPVLALGFGSLYNHVHLPNANFILDLDNETIDIIAIQDISPGEEITINYLGESGEEGEVWFDIK